jgi:hypothetical protein
LHVKRSFSDLERDAFRHTAFEYIANYFENSLEEFGKRNSGFTGRFRARDANSFEASIYQNGKQVTRCGIWLNTGQGLGEINYSNSGLGRGESYNESLHIADNGHMLGLKPMGFASFLDGGGESLMTLEGGAEHLWGILIRPLQYKCTVSRTRVEARTCFGTHADGTRSIEGAART